ncbi:hypothetical protein B0H14DRAFT_3154627 [Mycena olivaceomarginata]|nr:hypothetical protein B0H14DRAFT_3154627 [Mycena olivaceomarginata]
MSFLGEQGGLGTGGDAIYPRRARNLRRVHFAYAVSAAVLFPQDVLRAVGEDLERVLSAIRASVSEASANPGMATRPPRNARQRARLGRPRLPLSPFDTPASYNTPSKRSKRAQNTHTAYNELVAFATPTMSRPHQPPRSRPRPAPGHHDLATQALATRRARLIYEHPVLRRLLPPRPRS